MKIAFVNDTFVEGRGVDTVIYEIAKRLGKKHEVYVISTEIGFKEENFKAIKISAKRFLTGNTILDSISFFPNLIRFRKEILKLQKKYNFDIFNIHHSSLNPVFFNLPVIVTWHGSPPSKNFLRIIINRLMLKFLKKNKLSITVSKYLRKELLKIIKGGKVKVIYNGVGEEFKPINKDGKFMFFVGRMEKHKKIEEIIQLSKDLSYPIHIAGTGPLEYELKNYAKKINAVKIKFLGKISRKELINQYSKCSFFVSASEWEGFGLIFIEAAACSKASVGYKRGSIPEVIKDNKTGFLVNTYNELKQKTEIFIKDKKRRISMGKKALNLSKKFNWEKSARKYEKIFLEVKNGLEK